jgi:hypothetical protein
MATIHDMGIDALNTGIYHPKHKNRWKATFTGLGGSRMLPNPAAAISSAGISNAVTMQVVKMSRPSLSWEETSLHRYNSIAYVANKHSWEPISITLEDDVNSRASLALQNQAEKQQLLLGGAGGVAIGGALQGSPNFLQPAAVASEYKFACELAMLDGGNQILETWVLQGCWFKSINYGDVDYSAGDQVTIDVSLRYDHAYQIIEGTDYGTAIGGY